MSKLLGAVGVWQTKWPTLREWAYAGFFFNIFGAVLSYITVGDGPGAYIPTALMLIILVLGTYFCMRKVYGSLYRTAGGCRDSMALSKLNRQALAKEFRVLRSLDTLAKIQDFLDAIPINFELDGHTCLSPKRVLKERKAHCMEGAILAAMALRLQGRPRALLSHPSVVVAAGPAGIGRIHRARAGGSAADLHRRRFPQCRDPEHRVPGRQRLLREGGEMNAPKQAFLRYTHRMASRLIINADDLGVNPQRSHGIFQCFEFGVVTSATLVPNGSDSDAAARHARERELPTGLHLNLTEEYPLSKPENMATLVEPNGIFLGRERLRAALDAGQVQAEHLEREIRAQVEWFFDAHGAPTHVDGHHHIHAHPAVANALIPILERYGIRFVRVPVERPLPPFGYVVSEEQLAKTERLNQEGAASAELYRAHDIASTDHFRGLTLVGNASLKNLRHVLAKLPDGTAELMVHPSSAITCGTPFDLDPQRQTELRMLLDETIPALLRERKITLCSYADL